MKQKNPRSSEKKQQWQHWFALATKGSRQNHMAISHCCQARNQGGRKAPNPSQILNSKY